MHLSILTFTISLPGCRSRKEKRQRIGGLHERLGRNPAVAVCESAHHERLDSAEWTVVIAHNDPRKLEALCSETERKFAERVDGRIMEVTRESL